jgi:uncharacterized membrane protein YtjA (UPF0391 family)
MKAADKRYTDRSKERQMLNWVLMLFVGALAAAVFACTGIAIAAAGVAVISVFYFACLRMLYEGYDKIPTGYERTPR